MEENKIELRSEEVQDIMSRPPASLVRYGITVIAAVALLLVVGSFIFRYPDIIEGTVTITGQTPPNRIMARSDGRLQELRIADGQTVGKGDIIAVVENTASTDDILALSRQVQQLTVNGEPVSFTPNRSLRLGVAQDAYNAFAEAVVAYNNAISLNIYRQQIESARKELAALRQHASNLQRQQQLSGQRTQLANKEMEREQALHDQKLASDAELEDSKKELLASQLTSEQIAGTLSETNVSIAQTANRLTELEVQYQQDMQHAVTTLQSALNGLKVALGQWEQVYALVAPADGVLSYSGVWAADQNVTAGEHIFSVVGREEQTYIGKVELPVAGVGKIKTGQRVNIKLDGYPYLEFGYLRGTVSSLSAIPNRNTYVATIALPDGLTTTVGKTLQLSGELGGTAEIITEDISLGIRILQPLRYIFDHNL